MAGAYLTIGAKFRPFSYDEIIKPLADSTAMHLKIDEQYGELQQKANVWENLANKETDQKSYQKYKEYADALRAQAEDLAKNGLNPQSFRSLMDMKARYSSDIVPIEQAYTRRRQLADEQRKMQLQNPTLKFQRDMSTTSLDDFVDNPELDYGYSVNGALVAQQAGQAFAHLAKTIQEDPKYAPLLGSQYWRAKVRMGMSPAQIIALANNDSNAPQALKEISQQIYNSTGVEDFINKNYSNPTSQDAQEWRDYVNSYINQGAWNAVGSETYDIKNNLDYAYNKQIEVAKIKAGLKAGSNGARSINRNDRHLIGVSDENNKKYLGSFDTAGDTHATQRIIDSIYTEYSGGKQIATIEGMDRKTGGYATGTMSMKDFNSYLADKKINFTALQVDYETGNLIAVATVLDGKNGKQTKTVRIVIPYSNALNEGDSSALTQARDNLKEVELAKQGKSDKLTYYQKDGKWYITNGERVFLAKEYEEELKNSMFLAASGLLNYTGGVNQSTEAGQKLDASMDPYGNLTSEVEDAVLDFED